MKSWQVKFGFIAYLLVLAMVVFTPLDPNTQKALGILHITGALERILNLFLLVPLAIFSRMYNSQQSLRRIFVICLTISLSIELVQFWIPGRVSDPFDVVINSAGSLCALIWVGQHQQIPPNSI